MKHRPLPLLVLAILAILVISGMPQATQARTPVVHAVLFYSPTCPHCHKVMTEALPPLKEQYGAQLDILEINATEEAGQALYRTYITEFQVPSERRGVPALLVGETFLVGSVEIPAQFPTLIENGLAAGGVDWPKLTGLQAFLGADPFIATTTPTPGSDSVTAPAAEENNNPGLFDRMAAKYAQDPAGNQMAVMVLAVMIVALVFVLILAFVDSPALMAKSWYTAGLPLFGLLGIWIVQNLLQTSGLPFFLAAVVFIVMLIQVLVPLYILFGKVEHPLLAQWFHWSIPLLVVAGSVVAFYLAFVETTGSAPTCGPVGHCGTVQDSEYAKLFGILPVGVLGLGGNIAILAAWLTLQFGPAAFKRLSTFAVWGMSLFGLVFSIYLTFLEPFVIGATCMWCLSSAVVMTLFTWVSTPAAKAALAYSDDEDDDEIIE